MVNLYKIIGYNLKYSGPNLIIADPYETNTTISQYEEVILEATVDKISIPGPVTVSVDLTLPNGNEYTGIYMLGEVNQANKYRLRLNDVIGNELTVGETNALNVKFKVTTETEVFITNADISFELYKTNLDISYHPTDIDTLFIGLNKLSMSISDTGDKIQNYIDIANDYTDSKVTELKNNTDLKIASLNVYTRTEANNKFETKADHEAELENLRLQNASVYETKIDAAEKLANAKKYAEDLISEINSSNTGNFEGDLVLNQAKIYTDQKISAIISNAPDAYNTFKEIADYISKDTTQTADIISRINSKADSSDVYSKAEVNNNFVARVAGMGLSSNDYTEIDKAKLNSLQNYDDSFLRNRLSLLESKDFVEYEDVYTKADSDSKYALKSEYTSLNSKLSNYYTKTETSTLLNSKQEKLSSGTNIKTINGISILGSGNIVIESSGANVDLTGYAKESYVDKKIEDLTQLDAETLESIKELADNIADNQEVIDALNASITQKANKSDVYTKAETNTLLNGKLNTGDAYSKLETSELLAAKQNLLVSGQTIKTINGESILGEGNIDSINEDRVNELITEALGDTSLSQYLTKVEAGDTYLNKNEISAYAKTSYVDDAITNLLGAAPEALDTLQELAAAIENNEDTIEAINSITTNIAESKANKSDVYTKTEVDSALANLDLSNYYTKPEVDSTVKTLASQEWVEAKKYALSSDVPTRVSQLENDSSYINVIKTINGQSLIGAGNININADFSNLETKAEASAKLAAAKTYTDTEIARVINSAPAAFDTLKEIAEYIQQDQSSASSMLSSINKNKSDISSLQANLQTEISTRVNEASGIKETLNSLSDSTSKKFNDIEENYYTKEVADGKFLEYSETISKSEGVVDSADAAKVLKFSTDSAETDFVISDVNISDISAMFAMMIPNEY